MHNWITREILDSIKHSIPENIHKWLVIPSNITETIKKTGAEFSLHLLSQEFANPHADEIKAFVPYSVDASDSLVRRVFLKGNGIPMTFARVIIPAQTYANYHKEFSALGASPIGNTLLYNNKLVVRQKFEYKLIIENDEVFQELINLNQIKSDDELWSRRSIFKMPKGVLLISEVFLPEIPLYPC